jgi:hypothetical protein
VAQSDQFLVTDMIQSEDGTFTITCFKLPASTSNSGVFYPTQASDDGYSIEPTYFYNTTVANVFGVYAGAPYTSTTTTTTTTTTTA